MDRWSDTLNKERGEDTHSISGTFSASSSSFTFILELFPWIQDQRAVIFPGHDSDELDGHFKCSKLNVKLNLFEPNVQLKVYYSRSGSRRNQMFLQSVVCHLEL